MVSALSIGAITLAAALNAAPASEDYSQFDSVKIHVTDGRPHYLQSLPSGTELAGMTALERLVLDGEQSLQSHLRNEADLPPMVINGCARANIDVNGADVTVLFPLYTDLGNGRWKYTPDGTIVDGAPMIEDMQEYLRSGVELASNLYEAYPAKVNGLISERAPQSEARQNDSIEGTGLIFNDVYGRLPDLAPQFIRGGAKIFMAPASAPEGVLAITQTESNLILVTPLARIEDEIWGAPYVIAHELFHNHFLLQGFPFDFATEPELQAFTISIENRNNPLLFLLHGYGADLREKARIYFGFDSNATLNDLIEAQFDNYIYINEDVLNDMAPRVADIAGKMQDLLMDTVYPEYQSFRHWWLLADVFFQNDILPLEVALARDYEPALLSGNEQKELLQRKSEINNLILQVLLSYDPFPSPPRDCPSCDLDPDTFKEDIFMAAYGAGFNLGQSEAIYHTALKKIFVTDAGKINYGAMSILDMAMSISQVMYVFDNIMQSGDSFTLWSIAQQENVKKNYEVYKWLKGRLEKTLKCAESEISLGRHPSLAFTPDIFDPAVENPGICASQPDVSPLSERLRLLGRHE